MQPDQSDVDEPSRNCEVFNLVGEVNGNSRIILFVVLLNVFVSCTITRSNFFPEIQRYFGSDATSNALYFAMYRHINPKIQKLRDHVAAGGDAKDFNLADAANSKGRDHGFRCCILVSPARHISF
jgi:hypothetical protein